MKIQYISYTRSLSLGAMAVMACASANAAYIITDGSFELAGAAVSITAATTFGSNTEAASNNVGKALNIIDADEWQTHSGQDNGRNAELQSTTSYGFDRTDAPANASGTTFYHGQRASNQMRGIMQYTQDNQETTGLLTVSMDYWVYENRASEATTLAGSGEFSFQIFAFNDPTQVAWISGSQSDSIRNTIVDAGATTTNNFITSGQTWNTYNSTSAATGFQTISATIDLGLTGYNYIGIAVNTYGDDGSSSGDTEQMAFDNFQVAAPIPEPSTALLGGLGALFLLRRRRN